MSIPYISYLAYLRDIAITTTTMAFARLLPPLSVPLTDLTGRIAIVTGGNSGIGYQIVLELAIRGSTVYIACPHTFNPQDTISQIISQNPALKDRIHHLTLDLSSPSSIRTFVDTCSTLHLPITHLFHNAGIGASLSGQDFTPDGLPTVYATNFLGSFLLTHLLEPHLAPTIADLDHIFRTRAVDLVAKACRKAIADWGGTAADITHTVAASSTSGGSPGYDLLVNEKLGIRPEAQRLLLSGIGCAGGLATVRTAATIANDATLRGRPARILGFACDLTSTNVRCDLAMLMENPEETKVSMALFSHAAGAFVLCNSRGLEDPEQVIYSILDWESGILPGTQKHEQCLLDPLGTSFVLFGTILAVD